MRTNFTLKNDLSIALMALFVLLFASVSTFGQVKHTVTVTNYKFTPAEITIGIGDTVEWKNTQGNHNVNGTQTTYPTNTESFGNSVASGWTYKYVFKKAGKNDYRCDPHVGGGMVGKVEVKDLGIPDNGKYNVSINFSGMTPHVGQKLRLWVKEQGTGKEIGFKEIVVTAAFSVTVSGIELSHSYNVDFYSDHNGNGTYDAPPTDHAWRIELKSAIGDSYLNFAHNTNFTNIFPVTAISDFASAGFKVYPNPTSGIFYIENGNSSASDVNISVFDLTGKMKLTKVVKDQGRIPFDISNLNNGIYLVELKNNEYQTRLKLIKN